VRCVGRFLSVLICFFELRSQLSVFSFQFINALLQLFFCGPRFTARGQRKSKAKNCITSHDYAALLRMGAIARLCFVPDVAKNPAHSDFNEHPSHVGRYSCFQSLMERRAYSWSCSGRTHSWLL